jgi:hypothetical protein
MLRYTSGEFRKFVGTQAEAKRRVERTFAFGEYQRIIVSDH